MINLKSLRANLHLDLGIPSLLPQWKALLSKQFFFSDLIAGTTVACVAIPLSLAIALASGVSPGTGLITAIIAGIVCALFGGTPLSVSGPAAAMAVLIADNVETFGVEALAFMCLIAGLMQLLSGIFGLGKLARFVPLPVIAGFTAGIGVIIIIGQLPRAFGLTPPPESHIFAVFNHLKDYFHEINGTCLFLVVTTIVIIRGLPKILPKVPSILPAVIITTLLVYCFELNDVPLIGSIPDSLPPPKLPSLGDLSLQDLILNSFTIFLLASLETLLSSSALDKLSNNNKKHNPDQELIGQGLGNLAVSMFGGIPITSVIARSTINVRAGAKTRRSSIIHSLLILLSVVALAPLIGLIPIAALAGILLSIAFSMINYHEFYNLLITSRSEALIYSVTFFTIVFVDLIAGVQAGMAAAAVIVLLKAVKTHIHISSTSDDNIVRMSLMGALTFLSTGKVAGIEKVLKTMPAGQTMILDLSKITNLDTSGTKAIIDLYNLCKERHVNFYLMGLPRRFEALFKVCDGQAILDNCYLISEHELRKKISGSSPRSSRGRLIHGVHSFYTERKHNDKRLFEFIAKEQDPHTLFITCSDSRIVPSLITSSDPGELFIVRNVGNSIPVYQENMQCSEAAAIEFALSSFDITDVVICGHANCGAMEACKLASANIHQPKLRAWIDVIRSQLRIDPGISTNDLARMNALKQLENLKTYPIVRDKLSMGHLNLHAWFLDMDNNSVYEWNPETNCFQSLVGDVEAC